MIKICEGCEYIDTPVYPCCDKKGNDFGYCYHYEPNFITKIIQFLKEYLIKIKQSKTKKYLYYITIIPGKTTHSYKRMVIRRCIVLKKTPKKYIILLYPALFKINGIKQVKRSDVVYSDDRLD